MAILIIGGGIGGLTLALSLHAAGIACRVFEAAPQVKPLGVGINLLPHGMRELRELGLEERLAAAAVETRELRFYNRFGQLIFAEPRGRSRRLCCISRLAARRAGSVPRARADATQALAAGGALRFTELVLHHPAGEGRRNAAGG